MFVYLSYFFLNMISVMLLVILILVGVSFLTLMERKSLSYMQYRKGPNKVLFLGLFQPFSDGLKLFTKEFFYIISSFKFYYFLCPMMILMISLLSWVVFPMFYNIYSFNLGILFIFCCMGMNSYPLMLSGWSSNSIYPLFGSMRSCAQVISYEVSFIIITLSMVFMMESFNLMDFSMFNGLGFFYMYPIFLMFFISMLAELNRMPFDFIEGESELVSGFNTEYFGSGFSLIFMGEYCSIMFMGFMFVIFFYGYLMSLMFLLFYQLVIYMIIVVRGCLPRVRYDELMFLCWKSFLPLSLCYLTFILSFKWLIYVLILC